jgi:Delta7-sterol 5-desaturase
MDRILNYLSILPAGYLWLIFFVENVLITAGVLIIGSMFHKGPYTKSAWRMCAITNVINTVVTYAGCWLWQHHIIHITTNNSWKIIPDFWLLFFEMDLLMFLFHIAIHKTFLYKAVHQLHHEAIDPTPIDLFVLHPVETIGFGCLWLLVLIPYTFNIYAIALYLVVNVIFGLIGHLGVEPLPLGERSFFKYFGTSTFHHNHHQDIHHNFGFYTSIWDRIFGTYK